MKISKHWGPQSEGRIMLENEMYGKANVQAHSLRVKDQTYVKWFAQRSFSRFYYIKFITLEEGGSLQIGKIAQQL